VQVIERKSLDIVRCRDVSLLAKELGDFCLTQIFCPEGILLAFLPICLPRRMITHFLLTSYIVAPIPTDHVVE